MKSSVSKLVPSDSSSSQVGAVVVKGLDGQEETLPADVVVMGVGVAPATEYLRNSAVFDTLIDKTGAISVDEFLQVKGAPGNVFAIGTCVART